MIQNPVADVSRARFARQLKSGQLKYSLALALIASTLVAVQPAQAAKTNYKAADLTMTLTKSVAYIGKTIKSAEGKRDKKIAKRQQPFFNALKKTGRNVKSLSKAVGGKDEKKLFRIMDRTGRAVNEMDTAFGLSGIKDTKVKDGVKKLVSAFKTFRRSFGREAGRTRKGGKLSASETQQVNGLTAKYQQMLAQMIGIQGKVGKGKNAKLGQQVALSSELAQLIANLKAALARVGDQDGTTPADYEYLLIFEEDITGSWYAMESYCGLVAPVEFSYFNSLDISLTDLNSYAWMAESSFAYSSASYWESYSSYSVESSYDYSVDISTAEVSTYESYIEETSLEVSSDEYDITVGPEDSALLDHDDDGSFDTADADDDGDNIPDDKDTDDDGDGISDFQEVDTDGDGEVDAVDNDGISDDKDADDDNDGVSDDKDADDDGDGQDDSDEDGEGADAADDDGTPDNEDTGDDNDGAADDKDTDDDGDGEADVMEEDGDGTADDADTDDDGDGDEADNDEGGDNAAGDDAANDDDDGGDEAADDGDGN